MKKLAVIGIAIVALTLSGCSWNWFGGSDDAESAISAEVAATIKAAKAAIKKADSIGGSWRDTKKKHLKKAETAQAKGEYEDALKFAKKAKFEGEMGYKQAQEQAKAGPWLF